MQIEECDQALELIEKRAELFGKYSRGNVFKVPEHVVAVDLEALRTQRHTMEQQQHPRETSTKRGKENTGAGGGSSVQSQAEEYQAAAQLVEQLEERLRELEHGTEQVHLLANKMEDYEAQIAKLLSSGGLQTGGGGSVALIQELDATQAQFQQLMAALRNDGPAARPPAMQQQQYQPPSGQRHPGGGGTAAFGW
jgi:DNA repair exonuclease SbcCD ATPase subunit